MVLETKPRVFFILGLPGSGKGTVCTHIAQKFNMIHLSAGDLLRNEMNNSTEIGLRIRDDMLKNTIVPSEVTVSLISKAVFSHNPPSFFVIDGYPRNMENVEVWNSILGSKAEIMSVLWLECDKQNCIKRIMERSSTSGRYDDKLEALDRRFKVDGDAAKPVLEYYRSKGKLISIDASLALDEVLKEVDNEICNIL